MVSTTRGLLLSINLFSIRESNGWLQELIFQGLVWLNIILSNIISTLSTVIISSKRLGGPKSGSTHGGRTTSMGLPNPGG